MSSKTFRGRHLPVIISIVIALMLSMMPLPEGIRNFRPDWVALIMIHWAMAVPRSYGVGVAWVVGLVLDVSQGTLLGQHALALTVITFITIKSNLLMRMFPLLQLTATVFALNAVYRFLLFWINGVAGVEAPSSVYWGPVLTGALVWPMMYILLSGIRYRVESRH
ncbi:MAG: rod shape-determining protein MreD [Woeseiaceae bacterium]|nr:rod shape-determining protein MreD [Woeseiaceae bacterium]